MKSADDLVRELILTRFAERYEQLPYSAGHHILHCPPLEVTDTSHRESFACCESCPYVEFTALLHCEHAQIAFEFSESGRLAQVISELAELDEAA